MVETILTREMIEVGLLLVRKLDERGIAPEAALWLYFPEREVWRLVLALTKVGQVGPREVYGEVREVLVAAESELHGLSLDNITVVTPDDRIIVLLRTAINMGPGMAGIRLKNDVVNGTLIEGAYIYRLTERPEQAPDQALRHVHAGGHPGA
jgi:hypothetical protein